MNIQSQLLEKILFVLVIATFFVPLLLLPGSFIFPFIVPKILAFRALVIMMLATCVLLLTLRPRSASSIRNEINIIHWAVLFFVGSFALSSIVGVDWYKSLWDNHERMLGLFTILHYVIYFFVLSFAIRDEKKWKWLLRFFLLGGILVMFIGFIQKINPTFLLNSGSGRVSATLGNGIYYSGYGLFLTAIGFLLFILEKKGGWRTFGLLGSFAGMIGIFAGGTRGSILGFICALALSLLLYAYYNRSTKHRKVFFAASLALIGIFLLVALLVNTGTLKSSGITGLDRLLRTNISDTTASTRFLAWDIGVQAWKEKPIFGWGPNNYYYAFNQYFSPKFLEHGYGETWFDNAHSVIFNTLAVQGILGLLAYFFLFVAPIIFLFKKYRDKKVILSHALVMVYFLAAHFIHNAFVFENPTSYLYFFFIAALITRLDVFGPSKDVSDEKQMEYLKTTPVGRAAFLYLLAFLVVYITNINPAKANQRTLNAVRALYEGSPNTLDIYREAISFNSPHVDDIYSDYARGAIAAIPRYYEAGMQAEASAVYAEADRGLVHALMLHPKDVRAMLLRAQLAHAYGNIVKDATYLVQAEDILDEATQYTPNRQQVHYMRASVKMQLGKLDEAVLILSKTIEDNPKVVEGWWRLAGLFLHTGLAEQALTVLDDLEQSGIWMDSNDRQTVKQIRDMATDALNANN